MRGEFTDYRVSAFWDEEKELPNTNLHPKISEIHPGNYWNIFMGARRCWGDENAQRHLHVLEWEFKHNRRGENSPAWKGGKSFEPYCPKFTKELKEAIRSKYGRKCVLCGLPESENKKRLSVHHVDYDKGQGCNGKAWKLVPLCVKCHTKTNNNRAFWEQKILESVEASW